MTTNTIKDILTQNIEIFDFEYPFYCDELDPINAEAIRSAFEEKFIEHYKYREIGFDTVEQFKDRLRTKLLIINPYYVEWFKSDIVMKTESMLNSKDLVESTTRIVNNSFSNEKIIEASENEQNIIDETDTVDSTNSEANSLTANNSLAINSTTNNVVDNKSTILNKESRLDNGVSSAELEADKLTGVSSLGDDTLTTTNVSDNTTTTDIKNESSTLNKTTDINSKKDIVANKEKDSSLVNQESGNDNINETITFTSKGSMGAIPYASQIGYWRDIINNIDLKIINECVSLFSILH
jgi:hypothetical protein